ncbi:MAG: ABC transporter ATP-binding protein, partial [bacterium]
VPLVVASVINRGIDAGNMSHVIKCFILLILLAVLGMGFSFTAQWFAAKASVGFTCDLRQSLFDHIQNLSYSKLDTLGTDTLITRMTSDMNQVQNGINLTLRLLLRSPFIVFGAMIMAFTIDVNCAIIFALAIPVLSAVVFGIMFISVPLFSKAQQALDGLLAATRENLTGVRVIRAFCKEKDEIKEFDERSRSLTKMNEFVGRISALMNPGTYFIINMATIILINQGALRVNMGAIAQGDVVALYNYMAQIIVELIKLASLVITINKSLACANRIQSVFEVDAGMRYPDKLEGIEDHQQAICFDHASFAYGDAGEAISDISFKVMRGETIGIIGGTGSGKSTIAHLAARFYDVTKGSVMINGINVKDYPAGALIDKIGVVPQKAVLFEGSIRDNLKWGNENATDEMIWKAIDLAQAREVIEGKEGGLDAHIEQNGRNLSGGQRQRLTIARALVKNPEILILDDSASALDFATDLKLRQAIKNLQDMTVMIISQRTSSVKNSDLILVLDDGEMAGLDTHEELMKTSSTYQEIYYSQFPEERPQPLKEVLAA